MKIIDALKKTAKKIWQPQKPVAEEYSISDEIFRKYDIRGVYGRNLSTTDAYFIGKAYAAFAIKESGKSIVVGYDGRVSSQALVKSLVRGLVTSGASVINIGLCPTPMVSFTMLDTQSDASIMVTGSHNPKEHNGFKVAFKERSLFGIDIQRIKTFVLSKNFVDDAGREMVDNAAQDRYIKELLRNVDILGNIRIAWDIGNGSTSKVVRKIVKLIPGDHRLLFEEIDGNYPNRPPDPTDENNLGALKNLILSESFDLGIAFDGDGDRISVVTNKGKMIYGDQLLALFARDVLKKLPGKVVVVDVKTSAAVLEDIRAHSGIPVMCAVGHSVIKNKMQETNAILAGEISGHMFFSEWHNIDDGIYAALRLLELFSKGRNEGIDLFADLPERVVSPEIRIDCSSVDKFEIMENMKESLRKASIDFIDIDGVRVESAHGWWLVRASNTQDVLSARLEADTQENFDELQLEMKSYLGTAGAEV